MHLHLKKQLAKRIIAILFISVAIIPFAIIVPEGPKFEAMSAILTISGVLFAIIIGLFITDLWSRYETIRANVAIEVSGLTTYFSFVKVLRNDPSQKPWVDVQADLIEKYITKYVQVEWHEYEKAEPEFNALLDSLENMEQLKDVRASTVYNNMLAVLSGITDARETLIIVGKDRLSLLSWFVTVFLSSILVFCLFYINNHTLLSIILTVTITSIIIFLLLVLQDLNDLADGEESISFEPYEKVYDAIGRPRVYKKIDIESGRATPPDGIDYRLIDDA